jgi:hypothetical protein
MPRARRGPSLRRILCISAHPDDDEFLIGGSVAARILGVKEVETRAIFHELLDEGLAPHGEPA